MASMEITMAAAMRMFSTHDVFLSTAKSHKAGGIEDKKGNILEGILHMLVHTYSN